MKTNFIMSIWYPKQKKSALVYLLLPFSYLFHGIILFRRFLYRVGMKKVFRFPVPVIVVGNITVGGTGKTPLVIAIAQLLERQGLKVGIVSRGYGGQHHRVPILATTTTDPEEVGDEPVLMAYHLNCPVMIGANRVSAIQKLITQYQCQIIVSDDGLQHYAMGRMVEIAVIDGERQFGNGYLLPAGPLREPLSRLKTVDFIVCREKKIDTFNSTLLTLKPESGLLSVADFSTRRSLKDCLKQKVHAVAAIGHPENFFNLLRQLGFDMIEHVFPDHYQFKETDILFGKHETVIMTEKDAVKCRHFADERHWFLRVQAHIETALEQALLQQIKCRDRSRPVPTFVER